MNPRLLRAALALSLLINLGVLGAIAYRLAAAPGHAETASLPRYLKLDPAQLSRWQESEHAFLTRLARDAAEIKVRRDRMIGLIFSDKADAAAIDADRAAIARLQEGQQQLVIAQLLAERELLAPEQRRLLAALLVSQPVGASAFERLHRD